MGTFPPPISRCCRTQGWFKEFPKILAASQSAKHYDVRLVMTRRVIEYSPAGHQVELRPAFRPVYQPAGELALGVLDYPSHYEHSSNPTRLEDDYLHTRPSPV